MHSIKVSTLHECMSSPVTLTYQMMFFCWCMIVCMCMRRVREVPVRTAPFFVPSLKSPRRVRCVTAATNIGGNQTNKEVKMQFCLFYYHRGNIVYVMKN